jgi:hypothetical protein
MSTQITTAFVKQFSANVFHLSQQKGSRLAPLVRNETQKGISAFYERLGKTSAVLKTVRHGDTPLVNSEHSRRMVTMVDYEWADLVDDQDKIRMLISPESMYAQAAMWALGRTKDDLIIAAAVGTAYSGVDGATSVVMPNSQKIGSVNAAGNAVDKLNVSALRRVNSKFGVNDVDEEERYLCCSQVQLDNLLAQTEVTSADYNSVKALVDGKIDTFMGFKFIRSQRLLARSGTLAYSYTDGSVGSGSGDADGHERAFAWVKSGLLLATGADIKSRIDERSDKSYATQVYACMSAGATRLEEEKVVEVLCDL